MAVRREIEITTKGADKAKSSLKNVKHGLDKVDDSYKHVADSAKHYLSTILGSAGLIMAGKAMIENLGKQQNAEAQLKLALGYTSQALLKQASALQQASNYGDEQVLTAESLLAKYGLLEKQIYKLMPAIIDFATAERKDLLEATRMVGLSITGTTNKLAEQGIELDVNATRGEKLKQVMDGLSRYMGTAAQEAKTAAGQLNQIKMAMGDLMETLGGIYTEGLGFSSVTNAVNALSQKLEQHSGVVRDITIPALLALYKTLNGGASAVRKHTHAMFSGFTTLKQLQGALAAEKTLLDTRNVLLRDAVTQQQKVNIELFKAEIGMGKESERLKIAAKAWEQRIEYLNRVITQHQERINDLNGRIEAHAYGLKAAGVAAKKFGLSLLDLGKQFTASLVSMAAYTAAFWAIEKAITYVIGKMTEYKRAMASIKEGAAQFLDSSEGLRKMQEEVLKAKLKELGVDTERLKSVKSIKAAYREQSEELAGQIETALRLEKLVKEETKRRKETAWFSKQELTWRNTVIERYKGEVIEAAKTKKLLEERLSLLRELLNLTDRQQGKGQTKQQDKETDADNTSKETLAKFYKGLMSKQQLLRINLDLEYQEYAKAGADKVMLEQWYQDQLLLLDMEAEDERLALIRSKRGEELDVIKKGLDDAKALLDEMKQWMADYQEGQDYLTDFYATDEERFQTWLNNKYNWLKEHHVNQAKLDQWYVDVTKKHNKEIDESNKQVLLSHINMTAQLGVALVNLGKAFTKDKREQKRLAIAGAYIDSAAAFVKALSSGVPPWNIIQAATVAASAAAQIHMMEMQHFAKGGQFVTNGPMVIDGNKVVGDNPGGRELVTVTPLSSPNVNGPTGDEIHIHFNAPVSDAAYIDDVIIPAIRKSLRRGW